MKSVRDPRTRREQEEEVFENTSGWEGDNTQIYHELEEVFRNTNGFLARPEWGIGKYEDRRSEYLFPMLQRGTGQSHEYLNTSEERVWYI